MEYENRYASNGKGNLATTLGAIGTGLGVLNGGLGNVLGGWNNCGCSEDHSVNRYELGLEQANAAKDSEIALLKANIYNDQKSLEMYKYIDGELRGIRTEISAQAVKNAQIEGTFAVLGEQIHGMRNEFMCALNRERDERCCGDNSIVTYANATFYPKMIADITTGSTSTAQATYNPIPGCGCGCGRAA